MGHKSKQSKKRRTRTSHGPYVTSPLSGGFPPTLAPTTVAPYPNFNSFLAMHEELRFRIAPDCKVLIQFKGIATQSAIRKLITYLEMAVVDFPRNADSSSTQEQDRPFGFNAIRPVQEIDHES
jgi:hypothetical protein